MKSLDATFPHEFVHNLIFLCVFTNYTFSRSCSSTEVMIFLPARASEQGNVIGLVSVYIYI